MFKLISTLFLSLLCASGQAQPKEKSPASKTEFPQASRVAGARLTHRIIPAESNTWGYDILANGKLLIHQPGIPAVPGNRGFRNQAAAERVAQLVIRKIRKGEMPPTVTVPEMKQVKAL